MNRITVFLTFFLLWSGLLKGQNQILFVPGGANQIQNSPNTGIGVGKDAGSDPFLIYNSTASYFIIEGSTPLNTKMKIGAVTTANQYGITSSLPGDMVFQTIGTATTHHGLLFSLKDNTAGNYFKFGYGPDDYWIEFRCNDKSARFDGTIYAKEIQVKTNVWADYVFSPDFKLLPLSELDRYIKFNNHLPDVPTEQNVINDGINIADMNTILLKKIEELTLYVIQLNKKNEELENKIAKLVSD